MSQVQVSHKPSSVCVCVSARSRRAARWIRRRLQGTRWVPAGDPGRVGLKMDEWMDSCVVSSHLCLSTSLSLPLLATRTRSWWVSECVCVCACVCTPLLLSLWGQRRSGLLMFSQVNVFFWLVLNWLCMFCFRFGWWMCLWHHSEHTHSNELVMSLMYGS